MILRKILGVGTVDLGIHSFIFVGRGTVGI
jgi:hypothetical protein